MGKSLLIDRDTSNLKYSLYKDKFISNHTTRNIFVLLYCLTFFFYIAIKLLNEKKKKKKNLKKLTFTRHQSVS